MLLASVSLTVVQPVTLSCLYSKCLGFVNYAWIFTSYGSNEIRTPSAELHVCFFGNSFCFFPKLSFELASNSLNVSRISICLDFVNNGWNQMIYGLNERKRETAQCWRLFIRFPCCSNASSRLKPLFRCCSSCLIQNSFQNAKAQPILHGIQLFMTLIEEQHNTQSSRSVISEICFRCFQNRAFNVLIFSWVVLHAMYQTVSKTLVVR